MIVLFTDFGLADVYVGVMRGVIAGLAPGLPVVDLSHAVPPQDIRTGALWLQASWRYFPEGSVFVCVVDPGVGSERGAVVARAAGRLFVGPDNGLFGLLPVEEARAIEADWGLHPRSSTFHGRDLFAPVAARLAAGARFEDVGAPVPALHPLQVPEPREGRGEVLWVDHFGNLVTNLPPADHGRVLLGAAEAEVVRTYAERPAGTLVALTGSAGRLEVSVVGGDARERLGLARGDAVEWVDR